MPSWCCGRTRSGGESALRASTAISRWSCGTGSEKRGVLRARPLGQKPFHYHWDGRTLAFASDVHAVLALPWVPQVLNEGMVAEFLANEWLSLDETFWQGVLRLPQAHRMTVDARGPQRLDTFWTPDLHATLPCRTEDEYAERSRGLLFEAVRRMSRTIGPLACEVSGGLSELVGASGRRRAPSPRGQTARPPSLDRYALDFRGDPGADELGYVQSMREHLGIPVHEIAPTGRSRSRGIASVRDEIPGVSLLSQQHDGSRHSRRRRDARKPRVAGRRRRRMARR